MGPLRAIQYHEPLPNWASAVEGSSMAKIRTAVFPVAGRGTRFLPATKASPKEMLPIVDKPLIQYAAEEALAAGADKLVFITGYSKRAIEDHFDSDHELEQECLAQMARVFGERGASVLGVQTVEPDQTDKYGIVAAERIDERTSLVKRIIEKPSPADAPSNLAVVGRYILTPAVYAKLETIGRGAGGEIQLTDGIAALMADESVYAYAFEGKRYDCGSKLGYLEATVEFGLKHENLGDQFANYLARLVADRLRG
jgi:UTP--glucose-1-phosphate uridylyltransferase